MIAKLLLRFFSGLKFPWLFAVTAMLFGFDLIVPDFVPFADELLLGMFTLVLGAWRSRKSGSKGNTIETQFADAGRVDAEHRPT